MKRSNSGFYGLLAVLIAVASFVYCWKQIIPAYQKNQEQVAKVNKEIELSKVKLESLQTTKNSLDQLGDIVNRLFIAIPSDKDTPNLITELEAIAAKSETIIPSIQIASAAAQAPASGAAAATPKNAVSVSFSVNGTFENLNKMITALEKDIRFTNIKSLTYSVSSDGKTTSLALQFEVYKRESSAVTASSTASAATGVQK